MPQPYAWTRFWCPREGHYRLSNEGFLVEVAKRHRSFTAVREFRDIADTPVLILLGEPGIGKTFTIEGERDRIASDVAASGGHILWPDLAVIESPEAFDRAVTATPQFQAWLGGEARLHLYLDALDECMQRVQVLGRLLMKALGDGPREHLSLRLTCRTAEWKNELETDLRAHFGEERVKAFELLPLTKRDVALAVAAHAIDEGAFFDYVRRTGAAALASRPVPLDFLIRCFRRGELPTSQVDLYDRGCLTLCEETEHRMETGLEPELSPAQRLAVAKRIGASMVFSARSSVLLGRDAGDISTDTLRLSELAGGSERAGFSSFDVSEAGIRDALDTGLFTSRGAKILGWAHHTYEEYLAARYVSDSPLTAAQILPLIVHPDDPDRKLTPQLHGVTSWLTSLHPQIFDYVVEHEPELLLMSDVVIERPEDRARVVGALLDRTRERKLARFDVGTLWKLEKLAHPGIQAQLEPILRDRSADDALRRFAADMAEYTSCKAVVPLLTAIALDTGESVELRTDAASAVAWIGAEPDRAALRPLLDTNATSRQERWLIRIAVRATWPHAMSAAELFQTLSGSRRRLGSISDDFMLAEHVVETLRPEHLPEALAWVLTRVQSVPEGRIIHSGDALQRLEDAVIVRAFESDDDALRETLATIAVEKVQRHEALVTEEELKEPFELQLSNDASRRRRFAVALRRVAAARNPRIRAWSLLDATPYLQPADLDWLLEEQTDADRTREAQDLDTDLILLFADLTSPDVFEAVTSAAERNLALKERLTALCRAVDLDSELAAEAREGQSASRERDRRRAEARAKRWQAKRPVEVQEWLEETERQVPAFWRLLEEMSLSAEDRYRDHMTLDVQTFPGWIAADEGVRARVVALAERFVKECDPDADSWFGSQQFTLSAVGGVRALTLLRDVAPQRFRTLNDTVWKTWTPALFGIPNNDATVPLLHVAYAHVPEEVVRRVQQLLRAKDGYVVHKLSDVLDERLVRGIVDVLREPDVQMETLARALDPLLHASHARAFAEELLQAGDPRAITAAAALLLHAGNESWDVLWPAITSDPTFGRAVIERAVDKDHFEAAPVYTLTEPRVADLYLWLTRTYPPDDDPIREGIYTPDTRDNISSWRSRCLDSLKRRGTRAACDALRRLAAELPEQAYLSPLVIEAEAVRRAKSWQPTPVSVLRQLLADSSRRQVRSERELADVLGESLTRLEEKLQGETPAVVDLWNTARSMTPKTENEFTDYVARHLRSDLVDRGVVVGREVEIRRSITPGSGERTDIHVDVTGDVDGQARLTTVIVEAKGCWNRGVRTDLTEQLAGRYLADTHTRTGVYLVGWFKCAVWSADPRRGRCTDDPAALKLALQGDAMTLRQRGLDIRAHILDCRLREGPDAAESPQARRTLAKRGDRRMGTKKAASSTTKPTAKASATKTSRASAKKSGAKKTSSKRTLIEPHPGDKRYIRRDAKGRIKESDDVGRSLAADRRTKAKTSSKPGQGDKGDRKPAKKK